MSSFQDTSVPGVRSARRFTTTRWSLVLAAGRDDEEGHRALGQLCATYWYPLYAYVRRSGYHVAQAQDLTQAFFTAVLEKGSLKAADPERGRFRSFLLASLKHFLANHRRAEGARKRGGDRLFSAAFQGAEDRYAREPSDDTTPERIYERRWALTLLDRALERLERDYADSGKADLFDRLRGHLGGSGSCLPYREVAADLGMTEGAVKVAVHRLRRRFREILRCEIAETVSDPGQVEDELRTLFEAVGR